MDGSLDSMARRAADHIGCEVLSEEFRTSSHRLAQFSAALGETDAQRLSGQVALPTFAHVPVMQSMVEVIGQVAEGFVMHGEHDYAFHRPIVPGQRLFSRSRLTGVRTNGAGLLLLVTSDTWTHAGDAVCTQVSTCLVTGSAAPVTAGAAAPARIEAADAPEVVSRHAISPGRTLAYADAARDYSAYCLDPEVAAEHGFPAPIVHGMLSLSLVAADLIDSCAAGDASRLRRLGCRFSQPLFSRDGEELVLTRRMDAAGRIGFGAVDGTGRAVLTRGYAEMAR